jgi:hypothetical protein
VCHDHQAQAKYIPPSLRKKMEEGGGGGGGGGDGGERRRDGSTGLTEDNVSTLTPGASPPRDDDTMSEASAASTFSKVSVNPTEHAERRIQERAITEYDIMRAKKQGNLSLSIHLNGEEDANGVKHEINWWGDRLKEAFQQLELADVIEKGTEDRRVQVELRGSEKSGPEIKEWLKEHDYFREKEQQSTDMKEWLKKHAYSWEEKDRPHRVLFTLRRGQDEVVVVEGRSAPDQVGVITVFRAKAGLEFSYVGHQFDTQEFAVHFYNHDYAKLLLDLDADALALDAALTLQGRARIASGVWVIGPVTTPYPLSTWPPSTPFLLRAAKEGRATFVERLMRHYGCDVNYLDKDGSTALHLAAYYGHADVVAMLLDSGLISDLTIKNKSEGETALKCAEAGQEDYDKKKFKGPVSFAAKSSGGIDFTTRNGWPGWGEIIRLLEAARVDKAQ